MNSPLPFQLFQEAFARHIRDPRNVSRPAGVPARRAKVYQELLFNNICGVINGCFPVSKSMLGEVKWRRLQRAFFRDWRSQTPLFVELPREFLRWLMEGQAPIKLPAYLAELAHYEWAELAVDIMQTTPLPAYSAVGDLAKGRPVLAPAHMNLAYRWPVQHIAPGAEPREPRATQLVVFRTLAGDVEFVEVNPVTARLLTLLADGNTTGQGACRQVALELQHPNPAMIEEAGIAMLNSLKTLGLIYGVFDVE